MARIVIRYFRRLSSSAKFFIISFTICFFLELSKTIILIAIYGDSIPEESERQVYKVVTITLSPIQAYIYLKYCYAVSLMYTMEAALRWHDQPIKMLSQ